MPPWNAEDLTFDEATFSGVGRLFPLPNLVLYPHVVQPLHVFEERYREMIADALATDKLITMAILEPGWEPEYDGRPPIAPVGCLGKIITYNRFDDGRFNLLLLGVRRVVIGRELEPVRAFRRAELELITDCYEDEASLDPELLREELLMEFQRHLPDDVEASDHLEQMLSDHIPLAALTDLVAYTLPLDQDLKQQLLSECHVELRAQLLLQLFRQHGSPQAMSGESDGGFPPPFSMN